MQTYLVLLVAFVHAHPLAVIFWPAATFVLNFLLRIHPIAAWVDLACAANPRVAAAVKFLRAAGLDPVPMIQSLVDFVQSKGGAKAAPKIVDGPQGFIAVGLLLRVCAVTGAATVLLTACAWLSSHPSVAPDAIDAGACIAKDLVEGKTVAQTAEDCGVSVERVIADSLRSSDPKIKASPGYGEALHLKASLTADAGAP